MFFVCTRTYVCHCGGTFCEMGENVGVMSMFVFVLLIGLVDVVCSC